MLTDEVEVDHPTLGSGADTDQDSDTDTATFGTRFDVLSAEEADRVVDATDGPTDKEDVVCDDTMGPSE